MLKYSPDEMVGFDCDRTFAFGTKRQQAILYGGHRERVRVIAYRPDGQQLVSGGDVVLLDMGYENGQRVTFGHSAPIIDLNYTKWKTSCLSWLG